MKRRGLLASSAASLGLLTGLPAHVQSSPAIVANRPQTPSGVQVGDVSDGRAVIWSRSDRPSRMMVRWSTREDMSDARLAAVSDALFDSGHTSKIEVAGLPAGETIHYEVQWLDLYDYSTTSEPVRGLFKTAPAERQDLRFIWSGDTVGQGWGINPDFGGMKLYETMRQQRPDFFIHSGDTIYADGPIAAEKEIPDGGVWKNLTLEHKAKVAETLEEFRASYEYNLMDDNLRRFNAEVPMFAQWDDHEVTDNWYWELRKDGDERYKEGSVALMAARAMRAFHEFMPVRHHPFNPNRIYNSFEYGPSLEVFRIDLRSYRGSNSDNDQTGIAPETRILGARQLGWLKHALKHSRATWKVIASDMPIGLVIYDNWLEKRGSEAIAQGDGPALGRELEIAELLTFIRDQDIKNTLWLTADVHYTAAHFYDPVEARYKDFAPFWEFVSGPINAGSFGPNALDNTFGPREVFVKAPAEGQFNLPPSAGLQFFGQVDIDGESENLTVSLKDIEGATLFTQELQPEA